MELYVYNTAGVCLGVIEGFSSFRWVKRYNKVGEFKLVCHPRYRELLTEGAILWPSGDEEAGYIRTSVLSVKKGQETLEVSGETLTGLLGRRIIWDDITYSGSVETLMRMIVTDSAIAPANPDRTIPMLRMGPAVGFDGTLETYASEHETALKALEDRAADSALGFKTVFDPANGMMTFVIYSGVDRSEGQNERSHVAFSDEYDNLIAAQYRESDTDYANVALIVGEAREEEPPMIVSVGSAHGLDRRETQVQAGDVRRVRDDDTELTNDEYRAALADQGNLELAGMTRAQAADAEVLSIAGNLMYRDDYDLGDIVTVTLARWGVRAHLRITQVDESWEGAKHSVISTFGEDVRTQIERITRRIG